MVRFALAVIAALTGCAHPEPVTVRVPFEVRVPVPVRVEPAASLTAPLVTPHVTWLYPSAALATSALDADGEKALKKLLVILTTRIRAWERWAAEPLPATADVR